MANPYFKSGRWYLRVRAASGRWSDRVSKARTKAEAKRLSGELQQREDRIRDGLELAPPVDGGGTVKALLAWWTTSYLTDSSGYSRSIGTVRRHLIESELACLRLVDVTSGLVEQLIQSKSAKLGPSSLNHIRGYLSSAFGSAIKTGRFLGPNPVAGVRKRKVPRRVPHYLRAEEVRPVLAAVPARWCNLFAAAIYTGLRRGELFALRKENVDLANRLLTVAGSHARDTTKGGHGDVIPIAAELVPYLTQAMDSSPSALVFPDPKGRMLSDRVQLELVLRRALRRAGIVTGYRHSCRRKGCGHVEQSPDDKLRRCPKCSMKLWPHGEVRRIRFHDLRHTTASLLIMSGANPAAVQRILRHSDPKLTMDVYGHLAPGYLRTEIDRLSFGAAPASTIDEAAVLPAAVTADGDFAAPVLQGSEEGPLGPFDGAPKSSNSLKKK